MRSTRVGSIGGPSGGAVGRTNGVALGRSLGPVSADPDDAGELMSGEAIPPLAGGVDD
jgi:hypothetical protein